MKIHFGSTFGFENVYPRLATEESDPVIGEMHLGQKGLLEYLELHLGVKQNDVHNALRVSKYKKSVSKGLKHVDLYIRDSFEKDAWGTSLQLLMWRDELVLSMWDFECDDPALDRLFTLSVIEEYADEMYLGVNDRWKIVFELIKKGNTELPLNEVQIYEPKENLHPFFQNIFELLTAVGVEITWGKEDFILGSDDLSLFKQKLTGVTTKKEDAKGDDSILILKGDNDKVIADVLGEYFTQEKELQPVFIIPNRGEVLESALVSRGKGAFGYNESIEHGAFDQLLVLISLFIWEPIDPERLVQFLLLPSGPLKKSLKQNLAAAFGDKAGVGNDKWVEAIEKHCLEPFKIDLRKAFKADGNYTKEAFDEEIEKIKQCNTEYKKNLKDVYKKLSYWFDRKKYNPEKGADVSEVVQLYTDLKSWVDKFQNSIDKEDARSSDLKGALKSLSRQCHFLLKIIKTETKPEGKITKIKLNKWITSLSANRVAKSNYIQKDSFDYVTNPANIKSGADVIVWWNFQDEGNPLSRDPRWNGEEQKVIGSKNLHQPDKIVDQWYWRLCNGVKNCKKQLILCLPEKIKGEILEENPLYRDLEATFNNLSIFTNKLSFNGDGIEVGKKHIDLLVKEEKKLPERKTHWEISDTSKFSKRTFESYSSLSSLFNYPYAYILNYQLGIKPISIPEIAVTPLLKGNIAHNTAKLFWDKKDCLEMNDEETKRVLKECFHKIIEEEGAIFNLKKFKLSFSELEKSVLESLLHLINEIKANNWSFAEAEEKHSLVGDVPLSGYIDLVLKREKAGNVEYAIVDLKWGGLTKRKEELSKGEEIQLLIYDKLLNESGAKVFLHYYIISSKKMLSRSNEAFKNAFVLSSNVGEGLIRSNLWKKIFNMYNGRWADLNKGLIEVGDGLSRSAIKKHLDLWKTGEELLEMPPGTNGIKEEDRYGKYKNLIGYIND